MKKTIPQMPREIRDIPNTPGFKLTVFFHDAKASANATVEKHPDGYHYLIGETGFKINASSCSGWLPR
jgi:hypothetical protein